jgi:phage terminase large subunit-like protein
LERAAIRELRERKAIQSARNDLLAFMAYCWWMPGTLHIGRHTLAIAKRLTKAVEDWRNGVSSFLFFAVPFRHGKTDLISRALPAYLLGRCADRQPDIIISGYGASLVEGFSKTVKRIMQSPKYQDLFPGVLPGRGTNSASDWQVEGSSGRVTAQGKDGALTGKGSHLGIYDDYCKSIEEARSKVYLDKTWDGFRNNFLTRRNAPASITVIAATPWSVDDVRGRIKQAMVEDPMFPRFEFHTFPATKSGPDGWEYLFPEHFTPEWYTGQRATLGKQAAALLDCEPVFEGGNRFDVRRIIEHATMDGWPRLREVRFWDVASSSQDRDKSDPDWTAGVRLGVQTEHSPFGKKLSIWITSLAGCRDEAPKRDAMIREICKADGGSVVQHVEAFGAYKDAYANLKSVLQGVSVVKASRLSGDKSAKAAILEAPFDSCSVHIYTPGCRNHLDEFRSQFSQFPNGKHDDWVDATAGAVHCCTTAPVTMML